MAGRIKYDLVGLLKPLELKGDWTWETDGKFRPRIYRLISEQVWVYAHTTMDCFKYMEVFFKRVAGKKSIHSFCHSCWKVTCKPQTLKQLDEVEKFQQEGTWSGKCGIEVRPYVGALYGAYWYNRSFEEAKEKHAIIQEAFPDLKVIIKRGCTEFEMALGPSDKWVKTEESQELEDYMEEYIEYVAVAPDVIPQPIIDRAHIRWMNWAVSHGDLTYLEFNDGKVETPVYVTYQEGGTGDAAALLEHGDRTDRGDEETGDL